jgi:hydroxymethylpyrimidine/phosphomethylpyrimidine kinase
LESISSPPPPSTPPLALTIAGHDPSSGAGITADLLVFAAHGIFGTSAITSLTVQSTQGVAAVEHISGPLISQVLFHLNSDLPPAGIKIGMLGTADAVQAVAEYLEQTREKEPFNTHIPCVLDPVLISSSGAQLLTPEGIEALRQRILPLVDWITPNWAELAILTALPVTSTTEAEAASSALIAQYPHINVVVTGGDQQPPTDLLRLPNGDIHRYSATHLETTSTHGTGCAFSSALLSRIILGSDPVSAVADAKRYVTEAIRTAPRIGHGRGPLNLLWPRTHKS